MSRWVQEDPGECARRLGVSLEAAELFAASNVIDLHVDSFIWQRLFGYDIGQRHGRGIFGGRFYSQVDLPRLRQVGVNGATWIITTNPLRTKRGRALAFRANLNRLKATLELYPDDVQIVKTTADYLSAQTAGRHAAFVGIQGGNALDDGLESLDALDPQEVLRVTLVHLSSSSLGATSSPAALGSKGLSGNGRDYVRTLNSKKIFVDLAHIHREGFYDALDASDPSHPVLVTHTGVDGIHPHWRNLDDAQIRAVADRGGTIGIMYHTEFLGDGWFGGSHETVANHIQHVVNVVGDDHVSLGSDWDGAIVTPADMRTCLELPRLVEALLKRGFSPESIHKVLGDNFLRVLTELRG